MRWKEVKMRVKEKWNLRMEVRFIGKSIGV